MDEQQRRQKKIDDLRSRPKSAPPASAGQAVPDVAAFLEQLAEELTGWADHLGIEADYYDSRLEEGGSNDWGRALRDSIERKLLNPVVSALVAGGRTDLASDLRGRFDTIFADAQGYQDRLEAMEDQRRVHVEGLTARYRQAFPDDEHAARLWRLCQGPERVFTLWSEDGNPLDTPEQYAQAIDEAIRDELWGKQKARSEIQRRAHDVVEHLKIIAASVESEVVGAQVNAGPPSLPDSARAAGPKAKKGRGKWPKTRTQPEVAKYLSEHMEEYNRLVPQCLDPNKPNIKDFKARFGPQAIADKIGDGCQRQNVERTETYIDKIKPALNGKPPKGWKPPAEPDSAFADDIANMRRQAEGGE